MNHGDHPSAGRTRPFRSDEVRRAMTLDQKLRFAGRILLLGSGSVSQCLQPLLVRHLDMRFDRLTIMDFEDKCDRITNTLAVGAQYVQHRVTPANLHSTLSEY